MRSFVLLLIAVFALQQDANWLVKALTTQPSSSNTHQGKRRPFQLLRASTDASTNDATLSPALKDYSNEAASLFGNVRIPAALFAGAAAGSAFALPLSAGVTEGLKVEMVKRLYALLMMGALSAEIVAVVVSTLTMGALATQSTLRKTTSLGAFLDDFYNLEWISTRMHFLSGIMFFSVGTGLRAWITIGCPIIAKAALGIILSSSLLCLSFWIPLEGDSFLDGVFKLPLKYVGALWQRSKKSGMFAATLTLTFTTMLYILGNIPHIYYYLIKP